MKGFLKHHQPKMNLIRNVAWDDFGDLWIKPVILIDENNNPFLYDVVPMCSNKIQFVPKNRLEINDIEKGLGCPVRRISPENSWERAIYVLGKDGVPKAVAWEPIPSRVNLIKVSSGVEKKVSFGKNNYYYYYKNKNKYKYKL